MKELEYTKNHFQVWSGWEQTVRPVKQQMPEKHSWPTSVKREQCHGSPHHSHVLHRIDPQWLFEVPPTTTLEPDLYVVIINNLFELM